MNLPDEAEIARKARALKHANRCISRAIVMDEDSGGAFFSDDRRAELQATVVILMRAESDIWAKYPKKNK